MDLDALLQRSGLEEAYLATLDDLTSEELWEEVRRRVGKVSISNALGLEPLLHAHVQTLGKRRRVQLSPLQHMATERLAAGGLLLERAEAAAGQGRRIACLAVVAVPPEPHGKGWPHRLARARAEGKDLGVAEQETRYVKRLADELLRLQAPIVRELGATVEEPRGLRYLAAGNNRVSTLRKRLGDWGRIARWVNAQGTVGFPDAGTFLAYLEARASEPCGRTVLRSALDALQYMKDLGKVPPADQVASTRLAVAAVQELTAGIEGSRGVARRQANYLLVRVVMGFERAVVDEEGLRYLRVYAWLRLLKYWAALRYDDLRWLDPHKLVMRSEGLYLTLERTKVTGPGKKVGTMIAVVSSKAYYLEASWLATGHRLRQEYFGDNPYMIPLPTRDLQGAHPLAGVYGDAAAASQGLLVRLRLPSATAADGDADAAAAGPRGCFLLPPQAGAFWTEHSERNAMPTAAAALDMGDEVARRLGRWQTGQVTELYVRSTVAIVLSAQKRVAQRVRAGGSDFLGEEVVLSKLERYLRGKGLPEKDIDLTRRRLTHFDCEKAGGDSGSEGTAPTEPYDEEDPAEEPGELQEGGAQDTGGDSSGGERGDAGEGLTGYVVSVVGRKRYRRLHHLTKCGLIPGRDYQDYTVYGAVLPPADRYDSICSRCWRSRSAFEAEGQLSAAEPGTASSSGESDPEALAA